MNLKQSFQLMSRFHRARVLIKFMRAVERSPFWKGLLALCCIGVLMACEFFFIRLADSWPQVVAPPVPQKVEKEAKRTPTPTPTPTPTSVPDDSLVVIGGDDLSFERSHVMVTSGPLYVVRFDQNGMCFQVKNRSQDREIPHGCIVFGDKVKDRKLFERQYAQSAGEVARWSAEADTLRGL